MNHYPTTDIAMACLRTNEERPARVYGFDFGMDNPRNQDPRMPRGSFSLQIDQMAEI